MDFVPVFDAARGQAAVGMRSNNALLAAASCHASTRQMAIAIIDTGNIDAPLPDRQGSILRSVRCKLMQQQRKTRHCATCDRDIRARNNNPRLAASDAPATMV